MMHEDVNSLKESGLSIKGKEKGAFDSQHEQWMRRKFLVHEK
jgi:hypothetical protein